jgi:hypothetical protein
MDRFNHTMKYQAWPSEVERLVQAFIDCSLPREEWTHEAHLKVGLWHALKFTFEDGLALLRERIKGYNVACGIANTRTQGYHETITQCYLRLIFSFLRDIDTALSIDGLAQGLLQSYGDRSLLLQYYSLECLFLERARLEWVEPDRKSV